VFLDFSRLDVTRNRGVPAAFPLSAVQSFRPRPDERTRHAPEHHLHAAGAALQPRVDSHRRRRRRRPVQFIVRKDMKLPWQRGETPTHWIVTGLHPNLEDAMKIATRDDLVHHPALPAPHPRGGLQDRERRSRLSRDTRGGRHERYPRHEPRSDRGGRCAERPVNAFVRVDANRFAVARCVSESAPDFTRI
jgi:hypothetical protein